MRPATQLPSLLQAAHTNMFKSKWRGNDVGVWTSRSPVGVPPSEVRVSATRCWLKRYSLPAFKFKQFYLADTKNDILRLLTIVLFQLQSWESITLQARWMRWVLRLGAQTIPLPPVHPSSILFFKTFNFHAHQSKRHKEITVFKPSEWKKLIIS